MSGLNNIREAYLEVYNNQQLDEDMHPVYKRGGEQRRTQTPRQLGVKRAPHNIPKGGTTISPRDPGGQRLATGEQDRGKGSKAARRAAALQANKPKVKSFPNRLRRADGQGIRDSYDYYDIILSHLLDEGYAETPESAEAIMVNMSEEWIDDIMERMDSEERAMRRELAADKRASKMDSKVGAKYAGSEAQSAAKADKKSRGKHIHGTVDEAKDDSYLETDMKKRQKNNEKAVADMKKTKGYADMVKAARKHFDEETISERALDTAEKGEKERLVKGMKKSAADFKARYGKRAKSVMYATATARAKEHMDTSKSDRRYGVER